MQRLGLAIIGISLLLTPTELLAANSERDFYVGAQVGLSLMNNDLRPEAFALGGGDGDANVSVDKFGFAGDVFAGYIKDFSNVSIGLEAKFGADSISGKETGFSLERGGSEPLTDVTNKISQDYHFGLEARLGRVVDENLFIYAKLGALLGRFEYEHAETGGSKIGSDKETLWGISAGVGLECTIVPKIPVRLEYNYQQYDRFKTKDLDPDANDTFIGKVSPKYHSWMIGIVYYF